MRSGFFNDTEVWAEDFAQFAAGILTNGVLATSENVLKVVAGTGMTVSIGAGYCWINGHFGHAEYVEGLELATADGSLARSDRIVARLDLSTNAVYLEALEGTPAADPTPPSVRRDGTYYDLSLAIVTIPAGTLTITDAMITDTRRDESTCGGVFPNLSSAFVWPSANNVGDIKLFAGAAAPQKWMLCDGSAIRRDTYSALFSVIGTTYGAGNGETTFNIPDLRGRVPLGSSADHALGTRGGAETHALTIAQMPSHTHTANSSISIGSRGGSGSGLAYLDPANLSNAYKSVTFEPTVTNANTGGGEAFSVMNPFATINYIIYTGV